MRSECPDRFDKAGTEGRIGEAQRGAQRDRPPGVAAKALEFVMARVREGEDAHGSAPPRVRQGLGDQRSDGPPFLDAEAAPELDRALAAPQKQAQVIGSARLG